MSLLDKLKDAGESLFDAAVEAEIREIAGESREGGGAELANPQVVSTQPTPTTRSNDRRTPAIGTITTPVFDVLSTGQKIALGVAAGLSLVLIVLIIARK